MAEAPTPRFDDLYRELILDHYRQPRGRTPLACPDVENEGLNPVCGDEVKVELSFDEGRVEEVSIRGRGCAISTAAGSMLAEVLPGKTVKEVEDILAALKRMMHDGAVPETLDFGELDALAGVKQFPVRVKCALLASTTLSDALKAWRAGQRLAGKASTTEEEAPRGARPVP